MVDQNSTERSGAFEKGKVKFKYFGFGGHDVLRDQDRVNQFLSSVQVISTDTKIVTYREEEGINVIISVMYLEE